MIGVVNRLAFHDNSGTVVFTQYSFKLEHFEPPDAVDCSCHYHVLCNHIVGKSLVLGCEPILDKSDSYFNFGHMLLCCSVIQVSVNVCHVILQDFELWFPY